MNIRAKILFALLLTLFAFTIPAAAQPTITPTEGGSHDLSVDLTENVSMDAGGTFTINITESTLTGDLSKLGTAGTLVVSMDDASEVTGTISADGAGNIVGVSGGTITAAASDDTLVVENNGAINLTGTEANASDGNLISSGSSGTVSATDSTLSGNVTNSGADLLTVTLETGSTLTGDLINDAAGNGSLFLDMDETSSMIGSATSDGGGLSGNNAVNITGGSITAAASSDTIIVKNDGAVNLTDTTASANATNNNLIFSDSGGRVSAVGSTLTGNATHSGSEGLLITLDADSTLTGNLFNDAAGSGALDVLMDSTSSVTGSAISDGGDGGNAINITGGSITAAASNDTVIVENGGAVNLNITEASASDGNLIFSESGGSVTAAGSELTGNAVHEGNDTLAIALGAQGGAGSTLTGNLVNTAGTGELVVAMDETSSITGSAISNGNDAAGSNAINITGGTITAAASDDTIIVENGGTVNLNLTEASASDGNLIFSESGGTVTAASSTLTGNVRHEGDDALALRLGEPNGTGTTLTGDLINTTGGGSLNVEFDTGSSVTGSAISDGGDGGNAINMTGGAITAAASEDTVIVENGGTVSLTDMEANASDGNLIFSATNGSVIATGSTLAGNVTHEGNDMLTVGLNTESTLTGNIINTTGGGSLNVELDTGSSVTGSAISDGGDGNNVISINGGAITAAASDDTIIVENNGSINLNGTTAAASDGNLIFTESSGIVNAAGSTLTGNVTHEGDGTLALTMASEIGSTLTGNLTNTTGSGDLSVTMDSLSSVTGSAISDGGDGNNVISISGGAITAAADNNTLIVENDGTINLNGTAASATGGSLISSESGGNVTAADSILTGNVTHEGNDTLTIALGAQDSPGSMLTGDLMNTGTGAGGILDLLIIENSLFAGAVSTNADRTTNITVNDTWLVSGDSDLGLGNLDNGGLVDYTNNTDYMTVRAKDLGLDGATDARFAMKMDIAAEEHDLLQIADTATGSYTIISQGNDASAATTGRERFNLVEIGGASDATFALDNGNRIEMGAWVYSLNQTAAVAGTVWEIYSTGLSNGASAAVNTIAAGYLMGYADMNTLTQRLGELRNTSYLSGLWARAHGGKFNTDGMRFGKEFDLEYGGIQIGYDRKIDNEWAGELYVGVMFGYSKGDIDFDYAVGGGETDNKSLGIYGTYKQSDGFYLDAVLKYQWMNHEFDTFDSQGVKVTANDFDSGGIAASIEAGKRFELKNSWYLEPQAQLSYQKQDGGTFNMSNGLRLGIDDWTSLMGRIGARVGYENEMHNFYAKVSLVKEFDGDLDFKANGVGFKESFDDNWWVYGIGYISKINERNNLYLDIERASGGVFEQDWSIRAGWRLEF